MDLFWKGRELLIFRSLVNQFGMGKSPKEKRSIVPRVEIHETYSLFGQQVEEENRETSQMHSMMRNRIRGRNALALDPRVKMQDKENKESINYNKHADVGRSYLLGCDPKYRGEAVPVHLTLPFVGWYVPGTRYHTVAPIPRSSE
jgi:hypothetical protein